MTQDEIIEMACQVFGGLIKKEERDNFIAFANLVAAKEREACAKVCESEGLRIDASYLTCAEAIRARGEQA